MKNFGKMVLNRNQVFLYQQTLGFSSIESTTYRAYILLLDGMAAPGWCQGYFICFDVSDESEASLKEALQPLRLCGDFHLWALQGTSGNLCLWLFGLCWHDFFLFSYQFPWNSLDIVCEVPRAMGSGEVPSCSPMFYFKPQNSNPQHPNRKPNLMSWSKTIFKFWRM